MMTTICAFCLSNDRNLTLLDENYRKMVDFYVNTSEEDVLEHFQCLQRKQSLKICWECSTKLKNMYQFISTSQQCIRVLNTYLEASTQTLPATTSKLCKTHIEVIDTDPIYKEFKTEDMADTIDEEVISEETKTEDETDTEAEDVAGTTDTWHVHERTEDTETDIGPMYEETEMEDVTDNLDVKMEIDSLEAELNNIPGNNNGEVINSDIRDDPCTSVDLETIKEQVVLWRVILHRLPTDTLPANIMSSGVSGAVCDGTNNSRMKAIEDVPHVEALQEVTNCASKPQTTKEHEENILKKDKVINKTIAVLKIQEQKKKVSLSYICDYCKQKFNTKIKLQQHISIHYGVLEVNLICQTCNYKGDTVQALEKHSRVHDEKRRFKCNSCTYRYITTKHLMRHVQTHTRVKPYKCDFCDYASSRSDTLKHHMRVHTGDKPYKCNSCNFASSRSDTLKHHMRVHTGEKPYKCDFCDYASSKGSNLKKHIMRIHMGEKQYKFDYASSRSDTLKHHMRVHTGEKPYKCNSCNFASSRSDTLKHHMRVHTGAKPYKCDFCDYSSSHSGNLKRHMRVHTGEKPYKCDSCNFASSQSGHLKQHMRIYKHKKRFHAASSAT